MEENNLVNNITEQEESKIIPTIIFDKFKEKLVCPICNEVIDEDSAEFCQEIQQLKVCKTCESRFSPLQARWKNQITIVTEDKCELDRQLNAVKNLLQEKTQKLFALQKQVEERENKIYELKSESYKKSVENQISIDTLKSENSNLSNHIKNLEKIIKNLEKVKIDILQSFESKNDNFIKLEKENVKQQEDFKKLNEKYDQTVKTLNETRTKCSEMMEKMTSEETEKHILKRQVNELIKLIDSKENSILNLNKKVSTLSEAVAAVKKTHLKLEYTWNDLSLKIIKEAEKKKEHERELEEIVKKLGTKNNTQVDLENVKTKIQKIETDFTLVYREYVYISLLLLTEDTSIEKIKIYLDNSFDKIRSHIENKEIISNLETLDHEKIKNHPLYRDLNNNLNSVIIKNAELIKNSEHLENAIEMLKKEIKNQDENFEEIKILNEFLETENKLLQEQISLLTTQTKLLDGENKKIRKIIQNKTKNFSKSQIISIDIKPESDEHLSDSRPLEHRFDVDIDENRTRDEISSLEPSTSDFNPSR